MTAVSVIQNELDLSGSPCNDERWERRRRPLWSITPRESAVRLSPEPPMLTEQHKPRSGVREAAPFPGSRHGRPAASPGLQRDIGLFHVIRFSLSGI